MKALIVASILLGGATIASPKTNNRNFEKSFYSQVDKTNISLETFMNTSCSDEDNIEKAYKDLKSNLYTLSDLTTDAPKDQPEMVRAKEIEMTYGVIDFAQSLIQQKVDICKKEEDSHSQQYDKVEGK